MPRAHSRDVPLARASTFWLDQIWSGAPVQGPANEVPAATPPAADVWEEMPVEQVDG